MVKVIVLFSRLLGEPQMSGNEVRDIIQGLNGLRQFQIELPDMPHARINFQPRINPGRFCPVRNPHRILA